MPQALLNTIRDPQFLDGLRGNGISHVSENLDLAALSNADNALAGCWSLARMAVEVPTLV